MESLLVGSFWYIKKEIILKLKIIKQLYSSNGKFVEYQF